MTDWLTTHYPHYQPDDEPWHIYLQRQYHDAVAGMATGDRVFFYEYATRRAWRGRADRPVGAQGIVRVGHVSGRLTGNDEEVTEYEDGSSADWCWQVPVNDFDVDGFVPLKDVLGVLDYARGSRLRGFNAGTGVKRLDVSQGRRLWELFKAGSRLSRGA